MTAEAAITRMLEHSTQIVEAVIASRDGDVRAASTSEARGVELAAAGMALLEAGDDVRPGLAAERVVVELPTSSLVVVSNQAHLAVATTVAEPTVALVVFDLRSAVQSVSDDEESPTPPSGRKRSRKVSE
jgi:predicted regulator of Ras-like GTPase activity (Roadblock/LC7/MglB family)